MSETSFARDVRVKYYDVPSVRPFGIECNVEQASSFTFQQWSQRCEQPLRGRERRWAVWTTRSQMGHSAVEGTQLCL